MRTSLALVVALAGCPDRTISRVPPAQNGTITKTLSTSAKLDLLLIIDNSSSTLDKQILFAANLPGFVNAIEALPGGVHPDLHVGVVSTSVGLRTDAFAAVGCPATNDDGLLQNAPRGSGCAPLADRYLSDDGSGHVNYTGTLAGALSCIAKLGSSGCGFEAQLEAMKLALDGSQTANAGFLRPDAYLAIVFLTDEDDCSVVENDPSLFERTDLSRDDFRCQPLYAYTCDQPISASAPGGYTSCVPRTGSYLADPAFYHDFLVGLKDPSLLVVGLVAGDPKPDIAVGPLTLNNQTQPLALQPSCTTMIGSDSAIARPAIRLADFVSRFGARGLFQTVCQPSYAGVVTAIGQLIANAVSPCLEGALDLAGVDPANPTPTLPCTVADLADGGAVIPRCTMQAPGVPVPGGVRPCWWVEANAPGCTTTPTDLELHVEGAPIDARYRINCALAPGQ